MRWAATFALGVLVCARSASAEQPDDQNNWIPDLRPAVLQFEAKLPALQKAIAAHRASGRVQDADAWDARLKSLSTRWQKKFDAPNGGTELHLVGCYDGKRSPDRFVVYKRGGQESAHALATLQKLTQLRPRTFIGSYRPRDGVVTVGPTDMIWRSEYLLPELSRLERAVLKHDRENWIQRLGNLEFRAVYRESPARREYWARFDIRGANRKSLLAIPSCAHVTFDAQDQRYYALRRRALVTFSKDDKKSVELKPPIGTPGLRWPCGVAFDTKRKRVLIITFIRDGKLRSYTPNGGAWKTIASLQDRDYSSLTYDEQEDALYATHRGRNDGIRMVTKLSIEGKILDDVPIDPPIPVTRDEPVQIASRGEYLLMLVGTDRLYAIRKTTGAVVLGVRTKPATPR